MIPNTFRFILGVTIRLILLHGNTLQQTSKVRKHHRTIVQTMQHHYEQIYRMDNEMHISYPFT